MISAIMSVYNEKAEWIEKAVDSILRQTYSNFEFIIIIDNPDLDSNVINYLNEISDCDDRINLHFNEKNVGLMKSLNIGIDLARGEYIARMDADDISFLDRFAKELSFLEKNGYDMVSANRIDIDETGAIISKETHIKNNPEKHLPYSNFIVHPSVLIKTDVMKKMGGYRDFYNSEDYDLWLRLLTAGYRIGILDDYAIYYRIRNNSMSLKNMLETYYITKYQQNLYWERMKKGVDSFSKENFELYMSKKDISEKANRRYVKFRKEMNKAISNYKLKKPSFLVYLMRSFMVFPTLTFENVLSIIKMR